MAKIPKDPTEIFEEFTTDLKNTFQTDLTAIILYGSAATGEYIHKKSDINFLVVLTENGIKKLRKYLPLISKWQKRNVTTPLFLTKEYILSSLDSFPIEFLSMRMKYELVYGEDIMSNLKVEESDLRLACEREMKGKLLHLREGFLSASKDTRDLKMLISQSLATFTTLFTAILKLREAEPPRKRRELFEKMATEFDLDREVFAKLMDVRENSTKIKKQELLDLVEKYIQEIDKLTQIVDKI